jgi:geranylgeranylglycerol-phosphate geranylgeranyltransferase
MIQSLIQLTRPGNVLIACIAVLLGSWCLNPVLPIGSHWLEALIMGLLAGAGNVENDILDIEIDRINQPGRPLPSEKVTVFQARIWWNFLNTAALGASAFLSPMHLAWGTGIFFLLLFYNRIAQKIPFSGNIIVAFLCAQAVWFPLLSMSSSPDLKILWFPSLFAFALTLSREIIKDMEDLEGDRRVGLRTAPVVFGTHFSGKTAALLMILTFAALPLPYFLLSLSHWVLPLLGILSGIPLLISLKHLLNGNFRSSQKLLKKAMMGGLSACALSIGLL